jgi:hypothetical protein
MDGKLEAVTKFWEDVVCPCVGSDILSVVKPVTPVRPAGSAVPSKGTLSRAISNDGQSATPLPVIEEALPVVPPEEAFMSWEMYRDIVQVGAMVMIRNHEQQIRSTSRQVSRAIISTSKKPAFMYNTPATKGKSRRAASSAISSAVTKTM